MSHAMDLELMKLSLDEIDTPFQMPNLPHFRSVDRNSKSLIGRILNPACQPMAHLIKDMPRKWQKQGRVRGIALSSERFQFIFDNDYDLEDVLSKGVHTYNDWVIVVDRRIEFLPADYLQHIPLWVQIRDMPVNYYTEHEITALGDQIGEVKEVAFDPKKSQIQNYVRVKVRFDVSRPLRKSLVVNLEEGGSTVVRFNYERIYKRCFVCQCLNHFCDVCPLRLKQSSTVANPASSSTQVLSPSPRVLLEGDPLLGVLDESQVGIFPISGKLKIAPEVLEEMRLYLSMAIDNDRSVRIARIRASVAEAEKDPLAQKISLRLEDPPIVTRNVDKGKGVIFDFDLNVFIPQNLGTVQTTSKLLVDAFPPISSRLQFPDSYLQKNFSNPHQTCSEGLPEYSSNPLIPRKAVSLGDSPSYSMRKCFSSTEYGSRLSDAGPSGATRKRKFRRRPHVNARSPKDVGKDSNLVLSYGNEVRNQSGGIKRKATDEASLSSKSTKRALARVIPHEGSPST